MEREEFLKFILRGVGATILKKKNKSSSYFYDKGFLAESDIIAHDAFKSRIKNSYPTDYIITEEDEIDIKSLEIKNEFLWIVDPICGTTNYLYGFPLYSHSVTLLKNGQLYSAGVFDPIRDELFFSFNNKFYVNDIQFSLSKNLSMKEALISVNTNQSNFDNDDFSLAKIMKKFNPPATRRIRILESANLELAYVACGRIDAYYNPTDKPWDIAAAKLLIPSAGGFVHIINNSNGDILSQSGILAANSKTLLDEILLEIN
jgi:myo-inositol-1(or 4)-monophosphatase